MQAVPHDHDFFAGNFPNALPHGDRVEKRLGGVLVGAVPGVNHRRAVPARRHPLRQLLGGPGGGVADDEGVCPNGAKREPGVLEGFALAYRGGGCGNVNHIRAHPFSGGLKRGAGAGGVFVEEGENGAAAQGGEFFQLPPLQGLAEPIGLVH